MTEAPVYLLDSDVFIAAKNMYYAFDICPGFWSALRLGHGRGRVHSIDRVRAELLAGNDEEDLVQWVKRDLPRAFFRDTHSPNVLDAYREVMLWVSRNSQYLDPSKAKFATEADGWLAAYAAVHNAVVVTNEQPRPQARSRVLLPDVCVQFGVAYEGTFQMLRTLHARFDLMEA